MFHQGHKEGHEGTMEGCCHKGMKKELKLAFLTKKEKILEAKLEFVREMKKMVESSTTDSQEKE